jgi:hypothetical protein
VHNTELSDAQTYDKQWVAAAARDLAAVVTSGGSCPRLLIDGIGNLPSPCKQSVRSLCTHFLKVDACFAKTHGVSAPGICA